MASLFLKKNLTDLSADLVLSVDLPAHLSTDQTLNFSQVNSQIIGKNKNKIGDTMFDGAYVKNIPEHG